MACNLYALSFTLIPLFVGTLTKGILLSSDFYKEVCRSVVVKIEMPDFQVGGSWTISFAVCYAWA